jgi:hypothetical protein
MTNVFCDALLATHPARDIAGPNDFYAPLIGSWTTEVLDAEDDGSKRVTAGEWHFVRVLEGRGVQDVLIVPAREQRHARTPARFNRYGSSLRIFDVRDGTWRVQWCNPGDGETFLLESVRAGGDIVETGDDRNGSMRRWTLFNIRPDSFLARGETRGRSNGDGATDWKTVVEIYARREGTMDRMLADASRS